MTPNHGSAHANNESGKMEQATARDTREEQASVRCQEDLRLVASVFNEQRPQLSLAVVRNRDGARMLALGGRLDDLVLVALQPDYVELRSEAGEHCILSVFDPSARVVQPTPSARPTAPPAPETRPPNEPTPRAMFSQEELSRGLRSLADGSFVLTRELLLKALKNPGGAASGAHFRLVERDGRGVGMEVRAVREGSALSRMGLRSGDVIKSINGIEVTNPLGLLDVLRAARTADSVTLSIVHDGKERALRYRIE